MKQLNPFVTDAGDKYFIPPEKEQEFRTDFNGDAGEGGIAVSGRTYRTKDGQSYTVPADMAKDFRADFPDAEETTRFTFANGKTRDFTGSELKEFMAGEYRKSPDFQADREEDGRKAAEEYRKRVESSPEYARMKEDAEKGWFGHFVDSVFKAGGEGHSAMSYMTEKFVRPWEQAVAGNLRSIGLMLNGYRAPLPGHEKESRGTMFFLDTADLLDHWTDILTGDRGASDDHNLFTRVVGGYNAIGSSIGAFVTVTKALGPFGPVAMGTAASGNTYMSLYRTALANGHSPAEADEIAQRGASTGLTLTALLGWLPVSRMLRLGSKGLPVVDMTKKAAPKNFTELSNAVQRGQLMSYLGQTVMSGGEAAGIMAADAYAQTIFGKQAEGKETGWDDTDAIWEAVKAGGEGLAVGALLGAMSYRDYRAKMRDAASWQALDAAKTETGREQWAQMFPEGTAEIIRKRIDGQDISRSDINKAGYPEAMMPKEARNALGDALVEQFGPGAKEAHAREAAIRADMEAADAKAAKENQAAADASKAPFESNVEIVDEKPTEKPVEPVVPEKPVEKPAEPVAETPKEDAGTPAPVEKPSEPVVKPPETPPSSAKPPKKPKGKSLTGYKDLDRAIRKDGANERIMAFDGSPENADAYGQSFIAAAKHMYEAGKNGVSSVEANRALAEMENGLDWPPWAMDKYYDMGRDAAKKEAPQTSEKPPESAPPKTEATTPPEATEPVEAKETTKSAADGLKELADNPDEIDRLFDEALGEKESGEVGGTPAPATKPVKNKGKRKKTAPIDEDRLAHLREYVKGQSTEELEKRLSVGAGSHFINAPEFEIAAREELSRRGAAAPAPAVPGRGKVKNGERAEKERQAIAAQFGEGSADAVAALHGLFGASDSAKRSANKLGMAAPHDETFDENVYNTARPHFQTLLDGVTKSGGDVAEFIRRVAQNFGPGARQYLKRFAQDLKNETKGAENEGIAGGSEGNRDGGVGGSDAADGRGASAPGGALGEDAGGRPAPAAGGAGAERGVRAGAEAGGGGGEGDEVRPDGPVERHETAPGGGGSPSGAVPDGLVPAHDGSGAGAGETSLVHAPNGNIDTRSSSPVRLSRSRREAINARARELAERPVGSLTDGELDILRQFTGAGGLGYKGKSDSEKSAALNQHFTDYSVVDAMWNALEKAKVPIKDALEPAGGSGNFPGRRPEKNWTICELDHTATKILKHLFPGAKVLEGTFEDVSLSEKQDAVISNFPFLEQRNHPNRPDIKALHDFFFVHSMDQLKPNGVIAAITSKFTMDKANPAVRRELMSKGDIIGAFRLPQGQFQKNAGTDVITDIIFIQKRPDGVPARPENAAANALFESTVPYSEGLTINGWYAEHPECILGSMGVGKDKLHGGKPTLVVEQSDASDLSRVSINYKPYPVAEERPTPAPEAKPDVEKPKYPHSVEGLEEAGVKYSLNDTDSEYSQNIRVFDGVPHVAVDEFTLDGYEIGTHMAKVFEPIGGEIGKKIFALQAIVDDAAKYQREGDAHAQTTGLEEIADYRKRFGKAPHTDRELKRFFKEHGEESYFAELTSAFDKDFKPSDVWREQTRHEGSGKKQADENSSLIDQALASEDGNGEIDMGSESCKVSLEDFNDLLESGYSFVGVGTDGKPIVQNNVLFESGEIYKKIDFQRELKKAQPKMAAVIDRQIARLEDVLPTRKVYDAISFSGIEGWRVDEKGEHEGWIKPVLDEAGIHIARTINKNGMAEYTVRTGGLLTPGEEELVGRNLGGQKLITRKDGESDAAYMQRSREAENSMADIYTKIRNRVAEDSDRVARIEDAYNRENNGYVAPDYNKARYLIRDTIEAFRQAGYPLRSNQEQWVTQALIEGIGINAHDVGGGKTMAALALAHALKARGVCKKPMFVVPAKTITTSWLNSANGAQKLFPNAKIVNLGNLPADKRTKMLFDLSNSNADFVFISHEGFESIQLPQDMEVQALRDYMHSLIDGVTEDRNDAKKVDAMQAYIRQIKREQRDTRLTFDKLGVDCLIVDEAHNFKNVGVSSRMDRKGLGKPFSAKIDKATKRVSITSHRAHDFRFKADYITSRNNGRNVFLLTATPTPNKPIELYTMLRHMGERVLGDYGIHNDRDFANRFFETGERMVSRASGGSRPGEILIALKNVYELKAIMGRYIDRIPMEWFSERYNIPLPNETVETKFVDMSTDMEMVQQEISERVAAAAANVGNAHEGMDTVIGAFMNGRDAAVAPYVYGGRHTRVHVEGRTHDPKTDKIELACQLVTHEVQQGIDEGKPRTALIFTDVMGGTEGRPFIPTDIKESLVARGFKPSEIAIVTGSLITDPETGREVQASGAKAIELKGRIQDMFAPKSPGKGADGKDIPPGKPTIKVVIGSTSTIGEGLNLNTWTSLAINLDVPLTHGALAQRRGRMVRFGNQHGDVRTVNIMTRGSFDTLSYGIMANKVGWNSAIWKTDVADRISVEEEMANGIGIDPRRIIIESLRDPVEKIHQTVNYDLEDRQRGVAQARDQLASLDSRIFTQRRNAKDAQSRADEHSVQISKLKSDAQALRSKVPQLQKEADEALSELRRYAKEGGEEAKVDALLSRMEDARNAKAALEKAKAAYVNTSIKDEADLAKKLEDAKKANGDAGRAVTAAVNDFKKENQPFARVYRDRIDAIAKAEQDARYKDESVPYHESIVKTAERDVAAAEARASELEGKRAEIEQEFKDAQEAYMALGNEWFDDFGSKDQRFKFEQATMRAEMDEKNGAEDGWEDWLDERQTLTEAMPAPARTGRHALPGGKMPDPEKFGPTGTERPDRPTTKADIFAEARRLFPELHITNKGTHHRGRGVLGWLEVDNRVIRTVDPRAIPALCHELGHAVARLAENKVKMPRKAKGEFVSLGTDLYGSKRPVGGYASEGFAEFVRGFLCDYDLARNYPEAHKWFFETFGDKNPDFIDRLFALKQKILSYANMAPEYGVRAMWDHKLPVTPADLPWHVRAAKMLGLKDFKTNWVDSNWPILRAMREIGADYNFHDPAKTPAEKRDLILNHPYMLATFFQGSALRFAEVDALENTVDLYGKKTGDGLLEVLAPVTRLGEERMKEWTDYAIAMRAADYAKKKIESGIGRDQIAAALRKYRSPEFKAVLDAFTDWHHRNLRLLVDGGVIDEAQYQQICDSNAVYVPFMRVFAENEINRARQRRGGKALFKRRGGTQEIAPIIEASVEQSARIRQAAQQGKIIQALVKMYDQEEAKGNPRLNRFMVEMPNPIKRTVIWADVVKEQIGKIAGARLGVDEATIRSSLNDIWTEELFAYSPTRYNGKGNIVTVNVPDATTGRMKLRTFEIVDRSLIDILSGYNRAEDVTSVERAMQWMANMIRMGATTLSGSFSLVANPIRDTVTGYHMSEYGTFVPAVSSVVGMMHNVMNTDLNRAYFDMAGDMGRFYNGGGHMAAKEIARQIKEPNALMRQLKQGLFNMMGKILSIPEIGPRIIAFRNASNFWTQQGVGKDAADFIGRLCGGDITIDFGRAGTKARKANRVFLFLNAAIRELDQLARASGLADQLPWQNPGKAKPDASIADPLKRAEDFDRQARHAHAGRFWRRGAALASLAIVAYLLNNDNEKRLRRWRELKPEYKWNNTVWDFGDEDGESASVRLPVPFLDGLIFQALPVAIIEAARTGSMEPVNEVAVQMTHNLPFAPGFGSKGWYGFSRGFIPSAFQPITDVLANENWQEQAIEPKRMEHLDVRDRATDRTTAFAKVMGEMLGVSPIKLEHLYDQYTGGMLSGLLRGIENSTAKRSAIGVDGDYSKVPVIGRIFLAPYSTSRLPGEFYEEMDSLTGLCNSPNGRATPEQLGKLKTMEQVYEKTLKEYSSARREVLRREDISAEEAKRIGDRYAKATIDVIRNFNEYSKKADWREDGIQAAAVTLSDPASSEATVSARRSILERGGVDLADAQRALRVYGHRKGWKKETMNRRLRFLSNRW